MTQLDKARSSVQAAQSDKLFAGPLIRWQALTVGERFVCTNIVLLPIWWVLGVYEYMPLLLLLGVAGYEWRCYGKVRLKQPSLPVVASFVFGIYVIVQRLFLLTRVLGGVKEAVVFSFCPACWLWYIQSNNIRIRLEVVAWALTVSVMQMLGLWFLLQFAIPESMLLPPPPTLLALLTGDTVPRGETGSLNALLPYTPRTLFGAEQNRFSMFFCFPEFFGLVAGFIGIVALDIKNRFWSWLLLLACVVLIFLSATRAVWVALPIVVILRYLFKNSGNLWTPPIIFALAAIASFTILSVPPAGNLVLEQFTHSATAIDQARAGSTATRLEIYKQTWQAFTENPLWGHGLLPERAEGASPIRIGSHSVILGELLYLKGLVGTVIFMFFWVSLLISFYQTRVGRPLTGFCAWFLYTLVSPTMAVAYTMPASQLLLVLCAAMGRPKLKPGLSKSRSPKQASPKVCNLYVNS